MTVGVELPILISLCVILATAIVAVIIDWLKSANQTLREENIELRIRQEAKPGTAASTPVEQPLTPALTGTYRGRRRLQLIAAEKEAWLRN